MRKYVGIVARFMKTLKLLDYLIIIIILLAVILFYKFIRQEKKWINLTVLSYATVFQANSLKVGDYEVDSSGKKIAIIDNFEVVDTPPFQENPLFDKTLVIDMSVLADSKPKTDQIQYKNEPLAVGSQVLFNLNSARLLTFVLEIEGNIANKKTETKTLTANIYNQWPWFADSIKVGGKVMDSAGQEVAEVILKDVTPAKVTNVTSGGESVASTDPLKVDILLKIKAKVRKIGNSYIFRDYNNISIGKNLPLLIVGQTQLGSGVVTNIE